MLVLHLTLGYTMLGDSLAAEREISTGDYQAAVLDLGLPQKDGLDVLQALRGKKIATPVLVLTARDTVP